MAEEYVCTLDEASLKVAMDELNEDPRERLGQVHTFRQWILQQPHLKCPTDTKFLLGFLRTVKFSQLRARSMIDRFYTLKTSLPEWLGSIDMMEPRIQNCLKSGALVILPGRINGRKTMISRVGQLDLSGKQYSAYDFIRCGLGAYLNLLQEEATIVNGFMALRDFTDVTMGILSFFKMEDMKKASKMWEGTIPGRMKGIHYYNAGPVLDTMLSIAKPFLSKKMQSRIHVYGSNLEEVYKVFPRENLPDEYLPDDYTGPSAGPIQGLVDKMVEELSSPEVRNRILYITSDEYGVNESKRPSDVPQESFRKLQVD